MRSLLPVLVLGAVGCAEECPPPDFALGGKTFQVFNTVLTLDPPTLDAYFPGESSPANGAHTMAIRWDTVADDSAVTVIFDGEPYPGHGVWNPDECGNFTVTFEGTYVSEDGRATHDFATRTTLQTWEGHLEGVWTYAENWSIGPHAGSQSFDVQMVGTL